MDLYIWNSIFEDKLKKKGLNDPWTLALNDSIQPNQGWKRYTLQIFGRFRCSGCSRTWASAKIQILFHMKLETMPERRGWVKMRVFKQECKNCSGATFEEPEFLSENIEVALEKLVNRIQEKCYRDLSGKSTTSAFIYTGKQDGPHESAHCEACCLGLCDLKPQGQEPGSYLSTGKTMPASAPKAEKHRRLDQTPIRSLYNTEGLKEHQYIESAPQYKTKWYVSQSQKHLSSIYNSGRAEDNLQPISASLYNLSGSVNQTQKPLRSIYKSGRDEDNLQPISASLYNLSGSVNQTQEPLSSVYNLKKSKLKQQTVSASLYNSPVSINQTQKSLSLVYNTERAGENLQTTPALLYNSPGYVNQAQKMFSSVHNTERVGYNLQTVSESLNKSKVYVRQSQKSLSSVFGGNQEIAPPSLYSSPASVNQAQKPLIPVRNTERTRNNLQTLSQSLYNSPGSVNQTQKILSSVHNTERAGDNLQTEPQSLYNSPGSMNQTPKSLSSRQSRLARRYDDQPKSCCSCTLL
ncbi:uncharacterized protein LOC115098807 [Rhinatrema bivittatum]|uniref:uncharacterized protein LOC115098807 n=1 Tax=Rhinatrema bivittatum TaxID=194408 RepID=UPI00112DFDF6|nr:uncharacterized protein LOC115098807 [Rhinatrema bivittatum]